jgi:phosphotransferase system  glucose/maltose/N-acetylglucosamine-specific IIC component
MPSVPLDLQPWQSFYATLAAVAATLAGLLFVALSLNFELFVRAEHEHTARIARQTFAMFLSVLLVALLLLMPQETRFGLELKVGLSGAIGLAGATMYLVQSWRAAPATAFRREALRRFGWSLAVFLALAVAAIGVLRHWPWVLHWIGLILVALLLAAARRAWYLLVTVRLLDREG